MLVLLLLLQNLEINLLELFCCRRFVALQCCKTQFTISVPCRKSSIGNEHIRIRFQTMHWIILHLRTA